MRNNILFFYRANKIKYLPQFKIILNNKTMMSNKYTWLVIGLLAGLMVAEYRAKKGKTAIFIK
jgi:hypothetical protein